MRENKQPPDITHTHGFVDVCSECVCALLICYMHDEEIEMG